MAWTTLSFAFGSVLTSTKMTQLQDNFTALATGLSGAPTISRPALKSTTSSGSVVVNSGINGTYSLTGSTYSWYTISSNLPAGIGGGSDLAAGVVGLYGLHGTASSTVYFDERYIQASPPYKYGPVFVMLALNPAGEIIASRVSTDPIWAYHGPTNILPEFEFAGKLYRKNRYINGLPLAKAMADVAIRQKFVAGEVGIDIVDDEIDLDYKDRDAHVVPHGFGDLPPGTTLVLVRPGTDLMGRILDIIEQDQAKTALNLFADGYLKIDRDSEIELPGLPKIIRSCDARWRLTR